MAQDEMVRQYRRLNGHEFEQTQGDSEGQGSQEGCSHGIAKSCTCLATKQQKQQYFKSSSAVKNPSAMQEMGTGSLGQEVPLEKMVTHSSNLAWEFPYSPWDRKHSTKLSNQTTVVF